MSNGFVKGLAVTFGAGLAFGIGTKLGRSSGPRRTGILDLNPLIDRLDGIENRIQKFESRYADTPVFSFGDMNPDGSQLSDSLGQMDARLSLHSRHLDDLRQEIQIVETRSTAQVAAFGRKLGEVEARLPSDIEAHVAERLAALEQKLQADFRQTHTRTVDMFVQTIESKVVQRITALEQNLAEHSNTIVSLREKSLSTDENLQRLLAAVEKLCSQTAARTDPPVKPPDAKGDEAPRSFTVDREMGGAPIPPAVVQRARVPLLVSIGAFALGLLGIRLSR